jgi:hypothetical protein
MVLARIIERSTARVDHSAEVDHSMMRLLSPAVRPSEPRFSGPRLETWRDKVQIRPRAAVVKYRDGLKKILIHGSEFNLREP